MNKILIPILGLALGLVAGTAWTVATYRPAAAEAVDSLATDSLAMDSLAVDSLPSGAPREEGAAVDGTASGKNGAVERAVRVPKPAVRPVAAPLPVRAETAPDRDAAEEEEEGADQLARIFAAMQARDAARVLGHLRDDEIREILTRMGTRQAAAVLSNMEPGRAAVLSRAVLGGGAGE